MKPPEVNYDQKQLVLGTWEGGIGHERLVRMAC